MKRGLIYGLLMSMAIGFYSCKQKSPYRKMVDEQMATGQRYDSLFLGLYIGMSRQDFYTQCWEMNHKGLLKHGSKNSTAEYAMKDELPFKARMNFYPNFYEEKIFEMPTYFSYTAWAPWNKRLWADSLRTDVVNLFKDWYGEERWIETTHPKYGIAHVKVDGNRRISIYAENEEYVKVNFVDMSQEKEARKALELAKKE